jgi:hypothetical protein
MNKTRFGQIPNGNEGNKRPGRTFTSHTILVGAIEYATVKTKLTERDIRGLPPLGFHGTRVSELAHLLDPKGFMGHFVIINPAASDAPPDVHGFLDVLFSCSGLGVSVSTASTVIRNHFSDGHRASGLNGSDIPAILVSPCKLFSERMKRNIVSWSQYHVHLNELVGIIHPSTSMIRRIARQTVERVPEESVGWKTGRSVVFSRMICQVLADRIVRLLEGLASGLRSGVRSLESQSDHV